MRFFVRPFQAFKHTLATPSFVRQSAGYAPPRLTRTLLHFVFCLRAVKPFPPMPFSDRLNRPPATVVGREMRSLAYAVVEADMLELDGVIEGWLDQDAAKKGG